MDLINTSSTLTRAEEGAEIVIIIKKNQSKTCGLIFRPEGFLSIFYGQQEQIGSYIENFN